MSPNLQFSSSSPNGTKTTFHKYLKPGALARLRDSIIRSHRFNKNYSLSSMISHRRRSTPPHVESPSLNYSPVDAGGFETDVDFPPLDGRVYGRTSCPNRKKLVAIKPTWFSSPNLHGSADLTPDLIIDAVNSNVAAH